MRGFKTEIYLLSLALSFFPALAVGTASNPCDFNATEVIEKNAPLKGLPYEVVSKEPVSSKLCEVVLELNNQLIPLYTDGEVLISGEAWKGKKPITQERLEQIRERIKEERLKTLERFTVAEYKPKNFKGRWFYFVSDPECPYCNWVKEKVKDVSDRTGWGIKLVFLPLPFHKGALEKAKSFVCSNKTFEDYLKDDYGSNPDCKGAQKFNKALKELSFVRATPTFIVPTEKGVEVVVGANIEKLRKIIQKVDENEDEAYK